MKIVSYHSLSDVDGKTILALSDASKAALEGEKVLFVNFDVLGADIFLSRSLGDFLTILGEDISLSRSLGNFLTLGEVCRSLDPSKLREKRLPKVGVNDDAQGVRLVFNANDQSRDYRFDYLGVSLDDSLSLGRFRSDIQALREANSLIHYLREAGKGYGLVILDMPRGFGSEYRAVVTEVECGRRSGLEISLESVCILRPEFREAEWYNHFNAQQKEGKNPMKLVLGKIYGAPDSEKLGIKPDEIVEWADPSAKLKNPYKNSEGLTELVLPHFRLTKHKGEQ